MARSHTLAALVFTAFVASLLIFAVFPHAAQNTTDPVTVTGNTGTVNLFNSGATGRGSAYSTNRDRDYNPNAASFTNNGYDIFGGSRNRKVRLRMGLQFDIQTDINELTRLTVYAFDVDEGQGEIDYVYLMDETSGQESTVGHLSGMDQEWNSTVFMLDPSLFTKGHRYHFEFDVCLDWVVYVRTVSLEFTGTGGNALTSADLSASITNSGRVATNLSISAESNMNVELEYSASKSGNQYGSAFSSMTVTSAVNTKNVAFDLEGGAPKGTYQIDVVIKDATTHNTLKTLTTTAGYSFYSVSYNSNGGSNSVPLDLNQYSSGEKVTVLFNHVPSRSGYTFLGWSANRNASSPDYTSSGLKIFSINSDTTLYAVWRSAQGGHTTHTPGEWIVDKEPTCTSAGSKHKECTVCGEVLETGTIAATGHTTGHFEKDENGPDAGHGYNNEVCPVCGKTITVNLYEKVFVIRFVINGKEVAVDDYTVSDKNIVYPPIPEKTGYTGHWEKVVLTTGDVTINLIYEINIYNIVFVLDGKVIGSDTYTVEDKTVNYPAIPEKPGYEGHFEEIRLSTGDVTINIYYTVIIYNIVFVCDGFKIGDATYSVENKDIKYPKIPEREGYTGTWEEVVLSTGDITINVIYKVNIYNIIFLCDGAEIGTGTYTVENKNIIYPEIPEKPGYVGHWETVTLSTGDITINVYYTVIVYNILFVCEGEVIGSGTYTVDKTDEVEYPEIPEKEGYIGLWRRIVWGTGDVTIDVIYTLNIYNVTFVFDGKTIGDDYYCDEDKNIRYPAIPEKEGYTGAWERVELTTGDVTINLYYTINVYTITFVCDGVEIGTASYTVENKKFTFPDVPAKAGYTGEWETVELSTGDVVINAVYTEIRDEGGNKGSLANAGAADLRTRILITVTVSTAIIVAAGVAVVVVVLKKRGVI